MILSHFTALLVFALIVSTVFALITKNEPREQFRYGVFVFLSFLAVAFAVGIAVVAFGQYQRTLRLRDLEHSIPNVGLLRGPWYARRVGATIWEFIGLAIAGSVLLTLSWESARKKRWHYVAASTGVFVLMLTLVMMLKLRAWS